MLLQDFFDYKNRFMQDILTHEEIVHLIDPDVEMENAIDLVYKRVFPYEYVPETVQEGDTFICIDVDVQKTQDKTFLIPQIYVWVFTHKSKLRLPEGGVRTDKLCSEIAKVIDGSRYYGLGELNLYSTRRFAPLTDFQGKSMMFIAREFNRQYEPNRPTPVNRKEGV